MAEQPYEQRLVDGSAEPFPAVDFDDGNPLAIPCDQLRVGVHVHYFECKTVPPLLFRQRPVGVIAKVTAGPAVQGYPQGRSRGSL